MSDTVGSIAFGPSGRPLTLDEVRAWYLKPFGPGGREAARVVAQLERAAVQTAPPKPVDPRTCSHCPHETGRPLGHMVETLCCFCGIKGTVARSGEWAIPPGHGPFYPREVSSTVQRQEETR